MKRFAAAEGTKVNPDVKTVILTVLCLTAILSGCWGSRSSDVTGTYDLKVIAVDPMTPTTIYVGTDGGGVYKSMDGGGSWVQANNGLFDLKVTALAIDWFTPSRVYVGTEDGGLFSSFDYGEKWAAPVGQSPITNIRAIVVDRNQCRADSPPCRDIYVASQTSGVWRSTDSSFSFTQINDNLSNMAVTAMAIYPTVIPFPTTRLYIGTEDGGLFRRGATETQWTEANPGLKLLTQEEVVSLAVNPQVISELYIGTSGGEAISGGSGIYKSVNSGDLFTRVYDPLFKYTIFFVVPVIDPSLTQLTIYAGSDGLVKSVDRGAYWCILPDCVPPPPEILQSGLTAFAAAMVKQTDSNGNVSFTVDDINPTFYAALFNRKFVKTTDGGQTWTALGLQ